MILKASHLISKHEGIRTLFVFPSQFSYLLGKTFQKRSVSSPAPVTMLYPSGLQAKYNTL